MLRINFVKAQISLIINIINDNEDNVNWNVLCYIGIAWACLCIHIKHLISKTEMLLYKPYGWGKICRRVNKANRKCFLVSLLSSYAFVYF